MGKCGGSVRGKGGGVDVLGCGRSDGGGVGKCRGDVERGMGVCEEVWGSVLGT